MSSGISNMESLPLILHLTNHPTNDLELSTKGTSLHTVVLGPFSSLRYHWRTSRGSWYLVPCLIRSITLSQRYAFTNQSDTTCNPQYYKPFWRTNTLHRNLRFYRPTSLQNWIPFDVRLYTQRTWVGLITVPQSQLLEIVHRIKI